MEEDDDLLVPGGLPARVRPGRKLDNSRDDAILAAALEVLAEVGYAGMTLGTVAERVRAGKSTFYRRWQSKDDLVLDAVARMKRDQVDLEQLPNTGELRSDLLGLFRPESVEEGERKLRILAGLSSMLADRPRLAAAAHDAIVTPWEQAIQVLIRRAMTRGEVSATAPVDTIARVIPEMAAYRALSQSTPFQEEFLIAMVDEVLLPALHGLSTRGVGDRR